MSTRRLMTLTAFLTRAALAALALGTGACNDDAGPAADVTGEVAETATATATTDGDAEVSDSPDTAPIIIATKPSVTVTDQPDGVRRARIDATDEATWVQFGFAGAAQVTAAEGWDLAFQRIAIRSARPVAAIDKGFSAVTQAPAEGYVEDTAEATAFEQLGEWWNYNPINHTVSPKLRTFVLRLTDGSYVKIAVRDYYDDAGSTGLVTFDWAAIPGPTPSPP